MTKRLVIRAAIWTAGFWTLLVGLIVSELLRDFVLSVIGVVFLLALIAAPFGLFYELLESAERGW